MCYNEAGTLRPLVERTVEAVRSLNESFEILIVNDGSRDGSGRIADQLAAEYAEVRVFHHPTNLGIGQVLIDGYRQTRGEIAVIIPGDAQFAPEDLPAALAALDGADVVNVSRTRRNDPLFRTFISAFDRGLALVLFGLWVGDLHWIKVYRRKVLDAVKIESRTPLVDTELLAKARKLGFKIKPVTLPHHPRTAGVSTGAKLPLLVKTLCEMARLRYRMTFPHPEGGR